MLWLLYMLFDVTISYILPVILVVQFLRFCLADGDLTLLYKEKFGTPTSSLNGKVVWITGASSGIGEYFAYDLARNCKNIRLILSARREDELQRVKKACTSIDYGLPESSVKIVILDLADIEKHDTIVAEAIQCFGVVDILMNNAGRSQRSISVKANISVDQQLCHLNVIGTISLTKSILRNHMMERGEGQLAVVTSLAGKLGVPGSSGYCASKFALHGFFETLLFELAALYPNIKVTMIAPGPVVSDVGKHALLDDASKEVGDGGMDNTAKMPTARCARLMSVAIANKLEEVWISNHMPLLMTYLMQYFPSFGKWIIKLMATLRLRAVAAGNLDHGSYFKLLLDSIFSRQKAEPEKKQ